MESNAKIVMSEMLQACRNISAATAGHSIPEAFGYDRDLLENVYYNLYFLVESGVRIGEAQKDFPAINWDEIGACADVLAKNMEQVDKRVIMNLIQCKIPSLSSKLEVILAG